MSRPVKYNPKLRYSIFELYAEGLSYQSIAEHCGISRTTLYLWIKKYNLQSDLDKYKEEKSREDIESGLRKLSRGAKEEFIEDKFIYYRKAKRLIEDEDGNIIEEEYIQPVERTNKTKVKPPDSKSIEILARKYYKEFDSKAEEREINTKILEGFTMRELQEARKENPIDRGKYIEAEFTELSDESSEVDGDDISV